MQTDHIKKYLVPDWKIETTNKEIRTHWKESRKLVIHVRVIIHQEYSSTERKKSQNSPFQVKLNFKLPLRNLSTTTSNKVREITDNIDWLKSPSKKAVAIKLNSQSWNSKANSFKLEKQKR